MGRWNSDSRPSPTRVASALDLGNFKPIPGLASDNLTGMIGEARRWDRFGPDFDFDSDEWKVPGGGKVHFRRRDLGGGTNVRKRAPLEGMFRDFAKALFVLRERQSRSGISKYSNLLTALRYLHDASEDVEHLPSQLESRHFQKASMLMKDVTVASRYQYERNLVQIASWVNQAAISERRIIFSPKAPSPIDQLNMVDTLRTIDASLPTHVSNGEDAAVQDRQGDVRSNLRAERISTDSWDALFEVKRMIRQDGRDGDRLCMAIVELLAIGGWRVGEILEMNADCSFLDGPDLHTAAPILLEQPPAGIWVHYFLAKEKRPHAKRIPTGGATIALEAFAEIRRISEPARELARHIAKNGSVPRPSAWADLSEATLLSSADIFEQLRVSGRLGVGWFNKRNIPYIREGRKIFVKLSDIDDALMRFQDLPAPNSRLGLDEHLCIMLQHTCRVDRNPNPFVVQRLSVSHIEQFLGGRKDDAATARKLARGKAGPISENAGAETARRLAGVPSIFERLRPVRADGVLMTDRGRPIRITPHQFRHEISTAMIKGGGGYLALNGLLGRQRIAANRPYIHLTPEEMRMEVRRRIGDGAFHGPLAQLIRLVPEHDQAALREAIVSTLVATDIGLCLHDWSMLPCQRHGACGDCPYNFIMKGNVGHRTAANSALKSHKALVEIAERDAGCVDLVSNHTRHHRSMIAALERAIAFHDDPTLPDGVLIQVVAAAGRLSLDVPHTGGK